MDITAVKYTLEVYNGSDPTFETGCAICDKRAGFDVYIDIPGNGYGSHCLVETVCSEECFNLWLMSDVRR
jgi:hypothetical protein